MPLFKGFKFNFSLSSSNDLQLDLSENNVSPVYITGAYKVTGEQFYGSGSYGDTPKKITPAMVKLPPPFQPDPTDPDVIKASKSTNDLTQTIRTPNLPPNLRKSTPEVSSDPKGGSTNNRQSTDYRNSNTKDTQINQKDQNKLDKKRLSDQKKQDKIAAQQKTKEEKLRKEREKVEQKERAKQEKLKIKSEKAEAAAAKKQKKVPAKKATNPLAQGPNAPLPYSSNTLQSSISKASGPPPYEASNPIEARNVSSTEVIPNENDETGNISFGAPIASGSTWDMVAQHRVQVNRVPVGGGAANKVAIRPQEPLDPNTTAVTGRKSLYV